MLSASRTFSSSSECSKVEWTLQSFISPLMGKSGIARFHSLSPLIRTILGVFETTAGSKPPASHKPVTFRAEQLWQFLFQWIIQICNCNITDPNQSLIIHSHLYIHPASYQVVFAELQMWRTQFFFFKTILTSSFKRDSTGWWSGAELSVWLHQQRFYITWEYMRALSCCFPELFWMF